MRCISNSPFNARYLGVTPPISVSESNTREKEVTVTLMEELRRQNTFESEEEGKTRYACSFKSSRSCPWFHPFFVIARCVCERRILGHSTSSSLPSQWFHMGNRIIHHLSLCLASFFGFSMLQCPDVPDSCLLVETGRLCSDGSLPLSRVLYAKYL